MRTVASSSHYEVHGPLPNIQTGTHQPTHCKLLIDAIISSFDKRWRKIYGPFSIARVQPYLVSTMA
ncbi:hypothetical protein PVK06_013088 [Gossypium arboreum]|uniref:Uncharacterized protein n=1 Tax=Gossypium arboreum TaxID=29729 RepID=A0ABR0QEL0_GOSAR|nr:hypothetical protein PVK06_013088 [Gossypium arboreum]